MLAGHVVMAGKAIPLVFLTRVTLWKGGLDDPITYPRLLELEVPEHRIRYSCKPEAPWSLQVLLFDPTPHAIQIFLVAHPFPTNDIKMRPTVKRQTPHPRKNRSRAAVPISRDEVHEVNVDIILKPHCLYSDNRRKLSLQ